MVEERPEGAHGRDHMSWVKMKPGGHEEMGELNVERSQSVLGQG